jgi:4-amino-4-deoxy-L-arabinose transferase-like glycosyltransferase
MTSSASAPSAITPAQPTSTGLLKVQRWPRIWGPRMWKLLAFVIVLFAYRLWAVHGTGISLFFDEAQYWDWSRHLAWGYYSKPPLIAGLIATSTAFFGSGVLGVKALTMLLYPITALCLVGFARALWPTSSGVRTGAIAAAVFMTIPTVGLMGLFASTDAPLIMFWALASWALWRAQVTDRMPYWFGLGVACGFGMLSKYTMAAFALTALWALWAVGGPRRGLFRLGPWVAIIVALVILSPNLIWNAQNGFPTLHHTAELTTDTDRSGGILKALEFIAGQVLMLGPLALVAGIMLRRQHAAEQAHAPAPASQWATSQMMTPSQLAQSTQAQNSQVSQMGQGGATAKPKAERSSALYLASVTSYRYLWATSIPLQLVAVAQALHGGAHVNWAAPSMVGFTMLLAAYLSQPLIPLAAERPKNWFLAIVATNLLLTGVAVHLRQIAGPDMPSKYDALVRMRGWQEAFDDLRPELEDPVVAGLPVLADSRLLITQAAYNWRDKSLQTFYWNPQGTRNNHYELTRSLPNLVGRQDVLLVTDNPNPSNITARFAIPKLLKTTEMKVGPDRSVTLHLFFLRGFLGYDNASYLEQSGADKNEPSGGMATP